MNQVQKDEIRRLRSDGFGYAKIAAALGVTENTVKSFCKRNGLGGRMANTSLEAHVGQGYCRQCGQLIVQTPKHKRRMFCSDECRAAWWNSHQGSVRRKAVYHFICANCGSEFTAYGNKKRKYCSHACYIADRFGGEVI
jgi:endogenous inhibitor of DNA gyrase (YacG/DUF329 family)